MDSEPDTNLDLSSALSDAEGDLLRPTIGDRMPVPHRVEVQDHAGIVFDFGSNIRAVYPPNDLLHRFVNATDLVSFAKKFGPLAIFSGTSECPLPDPQRLADLCDVHIEPLAAWKVIQAQVKAVVVLIGRFRYGEVPTMDDLLAFDTAVGGSFLQPKVRELAESSETWRRGLALRTGLIYTRTLTNACRLSPVLRVRDEAQVELVFQDPVGHVRGGGISLPGALTVQLMSTLTGVALTFCSSCSRAYTPKRRPAANRNRFCSDCARKGPWLLSKRKRRLSSS